MTKKDIEEYHKLIKKLEEQNKEKKYGQQENEELAALNARFRLVLT